MAHTTSGPRKEALPLLQAYLPLDRRMALAAELDLPRRSQGSALFADVSGFTPLMEDLANALGPQQGAEELTHLLNALYSPLVDEVHRHRGSIVAFGGDALTCWFSGEVRETARWAAACGRAMLRHVSSFGPVDTPAGSVDLSMHVGIASGGVGRVCVGRSPYGLLDVLVGATVDRMAETQQRAAAGQVAVDAATAAHLPAAILRPLDGEAFLLNGEAEPPTREDAPVPPPLSAESVRRWLAEPLYRRVRAGAGAFAAEFRSVTSVFVHFAGLDYERDLEVDRKLQRYVVLAQEFLAPYEGYVSLVACGDKGSLMHLLFGAPIAHEDDTDRAVRFSLEFQEAVGAVPFIQEQRIGISRGRVYAGVLGSAQRCTYTVLGDEVNVSARLMEAAATDQVLVSQRVQRAVGPDMAFHSLGAVAVKGREELVPVFEPTVAQDRGPLVEERLVGREREEEALIDLLERVQAGRGHVLLLMGEAGVGKSALVRFLQRRADERGWRAHVGACRSYGQHTSYLPWRAILEQVCGLEAEVGPAERMARLEQSVAGLPAPADQPDYWQARLPLLSEAMGLEVPETALTRSLEGELRRDNTFQLLGALVRHLAAERPALVVLEDAYWADELSLALAGQIGRGLFDLPLLLVVVSRPFAEPAPTGLQVLEALPERMVLSLTPLEETPSLELARERLGTARLPSSLETLLQERAQGNPFFIEELLRSLQEGGHLRRSDGGVKLAGEWAELDLPDTVEGVIRARMDRLPEGHRLTLKVSSVIGRTFRRPLLREVHPAGLDTPVLARQLARLGKGAFTQLEEGDPEWRYAFRHPILHEVTYETLLFAQRRQLHGAIGSVLERWNADDPFGVLDLLAYHFARSGEREKAVVYLQRAGDKARREYANEVALDHYSQALERLLPEEQERRYDLLAGRERIYDLLGERAAQEEDLREMGELADVLRGARRRVEVLNRKARRAVDMGEFPEARQFAQQAWELAEEGGDRAGAAEAQKTLGIVHAILGEYERARRFFAHSGEVYRTLGDRAGEASCVGNVGLVYLYQGDAERARDSFRRTLQLSRSEENRYQQAQVLINLGLAESNLGAYERAFEYYAQAIAISREIGSATNEELALGNVGNLLMELGDWSEAAVHNRRALQLARRMADREGEATSLSNLGLLSAYQGDVDQGRRLMEEALEQNRAMGHRRGEASTLHHLGVVELSEKRVQAAQKSLALALALREEIGETGNALVTRAWLGLAYLAAGGSREARSCVEEISAGLEAEGYGGDSPEQEIWWAVCQIWEECGEAERAREALVRAYRLVQEKADRISDPALRRSFLEQVPVNREIVRAWQARGV